jgi:23S rRNA (adenine2503-C2)-methyltransferase
MSNLSRETRTLMAERAQIGTLTVAEVQTSTDGTRKLRLVTRDGQSIETVLIPDGEKTTQCISSQVGCAIDCQFCATATLGFGRNLTAGEIVAQVYRATTLAERRPTNLVFMGMGEPLHNFDNVSRALALLEHQWGAAFSPRRLRRPSQSPTRFLPVDLAQYIAMSAR